MQVLFADAGITPIEQWKNVIPAESPRAILGRDELLPKESSLSPYQPKYEIEKGRDISDPASPVNTG